MHLQEGNQELQPSKLLQSNFLFALFVTEPLARPKFCPLGMPLPAASTDLQGSFACTGELRSVGDKGHRVLLASVLPRLAQFEALPAALIPQLIQLSGTDDR